MMGLYKSFTVHSDLGSYLCIYEPAVYGMQQHLIDLFSFQWYDV